MSDEQSEVILTGLYPPFAEKLRQLLTVLGESWRVTEGLRSFAEQDAYYEQGRSRPGALITRDRAGYSGHNYGVAAHVRPAEDVQGYNAEFFKLASEAENLGLDWGARRDGNNKFIEMSRVEMVILSMDECLELFKKGGLPAVWEAFDAELGIAKAGPTPAVAEELKAEVAEEAGEAEPAKKESTAPALQKSASVLRREKATKNKK